MERIQNTTIFDYLLFGIMAFASAGIYGVSLMTKTNFISVWFRTDTLYYFMLIASAILPIVTIFSLFIFKNGTIKSVLLNTALYSYIFMGLISSASSFSIVMGIFGDVLMAIIAILYLATFISAKISEPKKIKK